MADNSAQMRSPSYRLPALDPDFLLGEDTRAIRFALEYSKADLVLKQWGIRSTIVVFGSARIPSPEEVAAIGTPKSAIERARLGLARWYEEARAFARLVSTEGGALLRNGDQRDNVIATGGGPGIMEAANRGAAEAGAPSIGFNISLPHEQEPNAYSTPELTFRFHYFAMRKMHLAMRANALAVFPGGFGTLDELFEILTLVQTGKAPGVPVLLFGRDHWRRVVNFAALRDAGLIAERDLSLFDLVDTAEEGWRVLLQRGLTAHTSAHNI